MQSSHLSSRTGRGAFLALALLLGVPAPALAQNLEIHALDVDQGLSVLIVGPTGTTLLVDGGDPGQGNSVVVPYLQARGLTGLDYSLMTHWHTDHYGGLTEVLTSSFRPGLAAFDRGDLNRPSNGFVSSYLSAVGALRSTPNVGQVIDLGGGATATVMSRDGAFVGGSVNASGDENAHSLSVWVQFGDFDFFMGGDLTGGGLGTPDVETGTSAAVGQVEVTVANHHGSRSSSNSSYVANLAPSFVIQSAGHDNPFGHPSDTSVDAWNNPGACRVQWCTTEGDTVLPQGGDPGGFNAILGHIVVRTDGLTFEASSSSNTSTVRFATFENAGLPLSVGELSITELLVDPLASSDLYGEWFEVLNLAAAERDLGGVRFTSGGSSFTVASRILVDPGQRLVVGVDGRRSRNGNLFQTLGAPFGSFGLQNGTSFLRSTAPGGGTIESVAWGAGGVAVTAGVSAERVDPVAAPAAANFVDASQAWAGGDLGSPGRLNDAECPRPIPYGTGKPTSGGWTPHTSWSGTPSLLTNDFEVRLVNGMPNKNGICFWGTTLNGAPFKGGTLYVKAPLKRMGLKQLDGLGEVGYPVTIDTGMVGTTRYYQFWFRDPAQTDGTTVGLSNGLEVTFCGPGGGGGPGTPQPGDVIVTEILKDPSFVSDSVGEWFEVYNATQNPIDLEGWTIRDEDFDAHVIDNGGAGVMLGAGQYAVLGVNGNPGVNGGVTVLYTYSGLFLGNGADEIVLEAPDGTEIDRVEYLDGGGWPDTSGRSLSLSDTALDAVLNDDPSNWCDGSAIFAGGNPDRGSPGSPNPTCP